MGIIASLVRILTAKPPPRIKEKRDQSGDGEKEETEELVAIDII
jgi:hypothetical protein